MLNLEIMSKLNEISAAVFYGSDTGMTEAVTEELTSLWELTTLEAIDACVMKVSDYAKYDFIFIGLPTWYDGELQSDFELFFDDFKTIDFTGKIVAMYGLGDQHGYASYFVDGLGILGEVILQNGGTIIGNWPSDDYDFTKSKASIDNDMFYGLALDEDNEPHKTEGRLKRWLAQVAEELKTELMGKVV